MHIEHIGSILLTTIKYEPLCFKYVLYVLNITKNLLSISQLLSDNNVIVEFFKSLCCVKARNIGVILFKGVAKGSLYQVQTFCHQSQDQTTLLSQSFASKIESLFASFPTFLSVNASVLNHSSQFNKLSYKPFVLTVTIGTTDVNLLHQRLGH